MIGQEFENDDITECQTGFEKMDEEKFIKEKIALLFNFFDRQRKCSLCWDDFQLFPKNLGDRGRVDVASSIERVYREMFERLCSGAGREINDSTELTLNEFVTSHYDLLYSPWYTDRFLPTICKSYFDSIDKNHDNSINLDEWREMFTARGITDENFIQSTFAKMDKNNNDQISREEFERGYRLFIHGKDRNEDFSFLYDIQD